MRAQPNGLPDGTRAKTLELCVLSPPFLSQPKQMASIYKQQKGGNRLPRSAPSPRRGSILAEVGILAMTVGTIDQRWMVGGMTRPYSSHKSDRPSVYTVNTVAGQRRTRTGFPFRSLFGTPLPSYTLWACLLSSRLHLLLFTDSGRSRIGAHARAVPHA
jgi:hypothetical protein